MRLSVLSAALVVINALLVVSLWPDLSTAPWSVNAGIALIGALLLVMGFFLFTLQIRTNVRNGQVKLAFVALSATQMNACGPARQTIADSPRQVYRSVDQGLARSARRSR